MGVEELYAAFLDRPSERPLARNKLVVVAEESK